MASVPNRRMTVQEYLAREETALERSEYFRGEGFAMTGGTPAHSRISGSLFYLVRSHLQGHKSCEAFGSDQRVFIEIASSFTYPDVSIACDPQFENNSLLNPKVICEVLSDSTEAYDRGGKFRLYRHLESLEEYVLVSQRRAHVERYIKGEDGHWLFRDFKGRESTFEIASIGLVGSMTELFSNVEFPPAPEDEPNPTGEPRLSRPDF